MVVDQAELLKERGATLRQVFDFSASPGQSTPRDSSRD